MSKGPLYLGVLGEGGEGLLEDAERLLGVPDPSQEAAQVVVRQRRQRPVPCNPSASASKIQDSSRE